MGAVAEHISRFYVRVVWRRMVCAMFHIDSWMEKKYHVVEIKSERKGRNHGT